MQKRIFPKGWLEGGRIFNCMQTNLYSVSDELVDFFRDNNFSVGVSVDFCDGARLTAGGQQTYDRVRDKLYRLQEKGVSFDIITVLAAHTIANLEHIFAEWRNFNVHVRLLPLFSGSLARPLAGIDTSSTEILAAMLKLFEWWFHADMQPELDPFDDAVSTITMKKLKLAAPHKDRRRLANEVLVVDPDGALTCAALRDSPVIGNLRHQRIEDIIKAPVYRSLINEEERLKRAICEKCAFHGPCDTGPIARNFDSQRLDDCPTERRFYPMVEAFLEQQRFFDEDFAAAGHRMIGAYIDDLMSTREERSLAQSVRICPLVSGGRF